MPQPPPPAMAGENYGLQWFKLCSEGAFFEAHEVLEDPLWQSYPPDTPEKHGLQALIQWAVSLEHLKRGNPHGAMKLSQRACQHKQVYEGMALCVNQKDTVHRLIYDAWHFPYTVLDSAMQVSSQEASSCWVYYHDILLPGWVIQRVTSSDVLTVMTSSFEKARQEKTYESGW
jgi:hypothetical protein